jgi:plasmid stability protein
MQADLDLSHARSTGERNRACVRALAGVGRAANVGQEIVGALKRRAARHGRSAEAEHREVLRAALREDMERASFKAALASMPDVGADEDSELERDLPRPSL